MFNMKKVDAQEYLNQIPMWAKEKNSLSEIRAFMEALGNPDEEMKIVHVAGTNGKGSVCAFLTSMLMEAGYRVGTFISPHLTEIRERFLLNGIMVDKQEFQESFEQVCSLSKQMQEQGYKAPTYFETLFYIAMVIFQKEKTDFVILETGMGGRLDVTNVVQKPLATVITSISLDHMAYLGDTREKIAAEKAGIIKPCIPVVYDGNCRETAKVIQDTALKCNAPSYCVEKDQYEIVEYEGDSAMAWFRMGDETAIPVTIPSAAEYQVMNGLLSVRVIELLNQIDACDVRANHIWQGLAGMKWEGRMEQILPGIYVDGAHNEDGIRSFTDTAARIQQEKGSQIRLLFAVTADKEYHGMIRWLCQNLFLKDVAVVEMKTERKADVKQLEKDFITECKCPVRRLSSAKEAVQYIINEKDTNDLVFCVGSLYFAGEIKTAMMEEKYDRF